MTTRAQDAQTIANLTESIGVLHAYIDELKYSANADVINSIKVLRNANHRLTVEQADLKEDNEKLRSLIHSLQTRGKTKDAI